MSPVNGLDAFFKRRLELNISHTSFSLPAENLPLFVLSGLFLEHKRSQEGFKVSE